MPSDEGNNRMDEKKNTKGQIEKDVGQIEWTDKKKTKKQQKKIPRSISKSPLAIYNKEGTNRNRQKKIPNNEVKKKFTDWMNKKY